MHRTILAFLLISLSAVSAHLQAAVPETERDALVAVFNAMDGPNWRSASNWLSGYHCENIWFGVTCNAGGSP